MRLVRVRVRNYRSIRDSGWFDLDETKTILVGPNEGGKTALLRALEQLNPGPLVSPLDPLRDFPRSEYNWIQTGAIKPSDVVVAEGEYELDEASQEVLSQVSPLFSACRYHRSVHLDNSVTEALVQAPPPPTAGALRDLLTRVAAHVDAKVPPTTPLDSAGEAGLGGTVSATATLGRLIGSVEDSHELSASEGSELLGWLDRVVGPRIDPGNEAETSAVASLRESISTVTDYERVFEECRRRLPVMVYVSTYPSVTPMIHLGHLADAIDADAVDPDDDYYFGNLCLLGLLGFSARELSDLGKVVEPSADDPGAFERYRRQLDERDAALNAASLRLTNYIRSVWRTSDDDEPGRFAIRITADQQYLKVVVEDALGVQIDLDQRSQGFRWLVSFFVIFFAQAAEASGEAVLLLDEPGLSLHALKQRQFRHTLSRLGTSNQVVFTTHSPFLVGADELQRVRIVELVDRAVGTEVRTDLAAQDPASILPIQEAVAFDLSSSLLSGRKSVIVETLADCWFFQATAALLEDSGMASLDPDIEIIPANSPDRMVYFSTLLSAEGRQVATLLDGDGSVFGSEAQRQQLIDTLGDKRVIHIKDAYDGPVAAPAIEELLRQTLVSMGQELGWNVSDHAGQDWGARPIGQVFANIVGDDLTRYRLAKEYLHWTRDHAASDLAPEERVMWMKFIDRVNQALA